MQWMKEKCDGDWEISWCVGVRGCICLYVHVDVSCWNRFGFLWSGWGVMLKRKRALIRHTGGGNVRDENTYGFEWVSDVNVQKIYDLQFFSTSPSSLMQFHIFASNFVSIHPSIIFYNQNPWGDVIDATRTIIQWITSNFPKQIVYLMRSPFRSHQGIKRRVHTPVEIPIAMNQTDYRTRMDLANSNFLISIARFWDWFN